MFLNSVLLVWCCGFQNMHRVCRDIPLAILIFNLPATLVVALFTSTASESAAELIIRYWQIDMLSKILSLSHVIWVC